MLLNLRKFTVEAQDRADEAHFYKVRSQKVPWGKCLLQSEYMEFYTVNIHKAQYQKSAKTHEVFKLTSNQSCSH